MKNLFKFRQWNLWRFTFYLFETGRWSIGIGFDRNAYPLLFINLIIFCIEFDFSSRKDFYNYLESYKVYDLHREIYEDSDNAAERISKKF